MGHSVSRDGISVEIGKTKAVVDYPKPRSVASVRSFAGFVNCFNDLIPHFASLVRPPNDLTKNSARFNWDQSFEDTFSQLKLALMKPLLVAFPDWTANSGSQLTHLTRHWELYLNRNKIGDTSPWRLHQGHSRRQKGTTQRPKRNFWR